MNNALAVCRHLRGALRRQKDFLLGLVQGGAGQDVDAARARLDGVSSELEALERFFSTETLKYRDLVNVGWGNPHCAAPLTGFEPPASLCRTPLGHEISMDFATSSFPIPKNTVRSLELP